MILIQRMLSDTPMRPVTEQIELLIERRLFLKRRWRGVAADGTEFGFDLESRLQHGSVIHQTETAEYIVRQQPELVYQLQPSTLEEAALMGWKIGNLHLGVQVVDGVIRITHDVAVLQLFEREGWAFEEIEVVFNPLRVTAHAS
ncbi:urease accessory protein UreE [Prosthecobacter dejongeii]|uniref:Urease accessory protein n=1 Tax=Prosthecobacter dejongeii TaxID=48465 RepID=A0A7W8DQY2_9BACT|nr:urease accessory protein UreE [Prosthecobacter dejongeii]MBB5038958.1 urease accessory protein [Prosthecobacter dejongeii]